jgi:ribosome-associated protein YbcJ (S4-like RNA binding protein)
VEIIRVSITLSLVIIIIIINVSVTNNGKKDRRKNRKITKTMSLHRLAVRQQAAAAAAE